MSKKKDFETAKEIFDGSYSTVEEIVKDKDKMEYYIQKCEQRLAETPIIGTTEFGDDIMTCIPDMISMIKAKLTGEYKDLSVGALLTGAFAIIYNVIPTDLAPGPIDDAIVDAFVLSMIRGDIKDYKQWRENAGKDIDSSTMEQVEKNLEKKMGLKNRLKLAEYKRKKSVPTNKIAKDMEL